MAVREIYRSSAALTCYLSCFTGGLAYAQQSAVPNQEVAAYAAIRFDPNHEDTQRMLHSMALASAYASVLATETKTAPVAPALSGKFTAMDAVSVTAADWFTHQTEGSLYRITPREIETSAGTFGDPSRYLQTLAGVMAGNDQRNDFLVRGGNPSENLFVIDNIEIPSINQLALSTTTGGLVSMLDSAAMQSLTLHTDGYDSSFDQRLSSIVEISTRPLGPVDQHKTLEFGIGGMGGSNTRSFARTGSLFFSARQSVLHYFTNDIGLNGVPIYRNAFLRAENRINNQNEWWGISLTGVDSLKTHGDPNDLEETNPLDMTYSGWRNTTGINLRHIFSSRSFAVGSLAYAEQAQNIQQNDQLQDDTTIYSEKTADRTSTLKFDWTLAAGQHTTITAGVRGSLDQMKYVVQQPAGLLSPYIADPTPINVAGFDRKFAAGASAAYGQVAFTFARNASLVLGERFSEWALGGRHAASSKAVLSKSFFGRQMHVSVAEYDQMPTSLYLLSFDNISRLKPIHALQYGAGATLLEGTRSRVSLAVYEKQYSDYPVASNIPALSLANIADTFGQAFLMFPMSAAGKGVARGAELTLQTHVIPRVNLTSTLTYARNWYSGTDGILRRGNYDIPLSANLSAVWLLPKKMTLSSKFTTTSGRPYTPDDMVASTAQNRDVYDLARINGVRSPFYARLDFRVEQEHKLGVGALVWHVGLENALNRQNFYTTLWQPRYTQDGFASAGQAIQNQMPLFPDGGIKYNF